MFDDYDLPDFDFDFGNTPIVAVDYGTETIDQSSKVKTHKVINKHLYRRFTSERAVEDALDWHLHDGDCYHIISMGDVDSLTFLKFILRQQPLDYCLLSTWCMALTDIEEIRRWLDKGIIKKLDCYVGEIFKGSYAKEYDALCPIIRKHDGRVCIFRNHAKIYAGFGSTFSFVIESSANINTNPRTENTVLTLDRELALFYKNFFDGIKSFERNFDEWTPFDLNIIPPRVLP